MAGILFVHGLGSSGWRALWLKNQFSDATVLAPEMPYKNILRKFWKVPGALTESRKIVTGIIEKEQPDLVIGSSLGAWVALSVACETQGKIPLLLLAPVWNKQLREGVISQHSPLLGKIAKFFLSFNLPARLIIGHMDQAVCPARTLIIHSRNDELVDPEQSRILQRANVVSEEIKSGWVNPIATQMAASELLPDQASDGRLFLAGSGHRLAGHDGSKAILAAAEAILSLR